LYPPFAEILATLRPAGSPPIITTLTSPLHRTSSAVSKSKLPTTYTGIFKSFFNLLAA